MLYKSLFMHFVLLLKLPYGNHVRLCCRCAYESDAAARLHPYTFTIVPPYTLAPLQPCNLTPLQPCTPTPLQSRYLIRLHACALFSHVLPYGNHVKLLHNSYCLRFRTLITLDCVAAVQLYLLLLHSYTLTPLRPYSLTPLHHCNPATLHPCNLAPLNPCTLATSFAYTRAALLSLVLSYGNHVNL